MSFQADSVHQIKNRINENKSTSRDVTKKLQKKKKSNIRKKILKVAQEKRYLAKKKLHLN